MMTSRERLFDRLAGKPVDRIPNLSIVMQFAARHAGIPYGEFVSSPEKMVEGQGRTARDFGLDILTVMSDPYRETSAFGAQIVYQHDDMPLCKSKVLTDFDRWEEQLTPFDPCKSARTAHTIRAVALFKQDYGNEYAIAGWIEGALAEFCDLSSVNDAMMLLYDDPEKLNECLEFITAQGLRYAKAQIDAGADFIGIGDAVASLVSEEMYAGWVMPHEMRMINEIHRLGAKVKLHICGNINHLLPKMVLTGADIVDIDYMVDYAYAMRLSEGKCAICGNISPAADILEGTPETVRRKTLACAALSGHTGLISSGCEVPKYSPDSNFKAIRDTLIELSDN